MELSRKEEYRNQKVSLGITLFSFVVMLLFFIYTNVISASSAPVNANVPDLVLSLSNGNEERSAAKSELNSNVSPQKSVSEEKSSSFVEGEAPVNMAQSVSEKYLGAKPKNVQSDLISEDVKGPESSTNVGIKSPGTIGNKAGLGFDLADRTLVQAPHFSSDTQEQGTVVLEIVVNENGEVIEANSNGRGTNTSSSSLKDKARKMAFATKFSSTKKQEEQRGTLTIIFSYN